MLEVKSIQKVAQVSGAQMQNDSKVCQPWAAQPRCESSIFLAKSSLMGRFNRSVDYLKSRKNFYLGFLCFGICSHQKSEYCFLCHILLLSLPFDSVSELSLSVYRQGHWLLRWSTNKLKEAWQVGYCRVWLATSSRRCR